MTDKSSFDKKRLITIIISALLASGFIIYTIIDPKPFENETRNELLKISVTRLLGAGIFVAVMIYMGYSRIFRLHEKGRHEKILLSLPFMLVAVNNLPIYGLVTGNAYLEDSSPLSMTLFILSCTAIGLFEEFAFRGTLLMFLLERRKDTRKKIFWMIVLASAIFGLIHLVNLAEGAAVGPVILQVGYSFLIGGMCAVAMIFTKSIWLPVILHAVFDFCGKMVPTLGRGEIWDTFTVILTAVIGTAIFIYTLLVFKKIEPEDAEELFLK